MTLKITADGSGENMESIIENGRQLINTRPNV